MHRRFNSIKKRAISTVAIVVIVIVIIAIAAVGAYAATTLGKSSTTPTTSNTSTTSTTTSTSSTAFLGGQSVILNGAGSTLVQPAMAEWTYNFTSLYPNIRLNYASVGSGTGVTDISGNLVNFGASDAPLTASQYGNSTSGLASKGILQIPEIAGGIVPVYNLPGNPSLKFNGTVLADIFLGTITQWNDTALQQLNPGVTLPSHQIITVHRSDGSGTTYVFTDYLSHSSSLFNSTIGSSTAPSWCTGAGGGNPSPNCGSSIAAIGTKGSSGVTGYIQGNSYTLGYVEVVYATEASLKFGAIQNAAGNFVLANSTTETAAVTAAASTTTFPSANESWASVSLVDLLLKNTTPNLYPLTTLTYIMVYQNQGSISGVSQAQATALAAFLWWIINDAQGYAANMGYIALPSQLVNIDNAAIKSMNYNGQALSFPTS